MAVTAKEDESGEAPAEGTKALEVAKDVTQEAKDEESAAKNNKNIALDIREKAALLVKTAKSCADGCDSVSCGDSLQPIIDDIIGKPDDVVPVPGPSDSDDEDSDEGTDNEDTDNEDTDNEGSGGEETEDTPLDPYTKGFEDGMKEAEDLIKSYIFTNPDCSECMESFLNQVQTEIKQKFPLETVCTKAVTKTPVADSGADSAPETADSGDDPAPETADGTAAASP